MSDYVGQSSNNDIFIDIHGKWKDVKDKLRNTEDADNIAKVLFGIATGDIEGVYSLPNSMIATILIGYTPEEMRRVLTNEDFNQLKCGQYQNIETIIEIITDQVSALHKQYEAIKNEKLELSDEFIKDCHRLSLNSHPFTVVGPEGGKVTQYVRPGRWKIVPNSPRVKQGVDTKGIAPIFEYCPPSEVEAEIAVLIKEFNTLNGTNDHNYNPIDIAAWLHHAFILIHPFMDGNGRTARVLTSLELMSNNLPPLVTKARDRKTYINALKIADKENDLSALTKFVEYCLYDAIADVESFVSKKVTLKDVATLLEERKKESEKFRNDYCKEFAQEIIIE